jgi:hypothetical protein
MKVPKATTQDVDIVCIRWLPIDIDPKRPSDISASDQEIKEAELVANDVAQWLENEMGWSKGIRGFSGNGYHLLYRLPDLPNNKETHELIVRAIKAIHTKFDTDKVSLDQAVVNPARIWKFYGTTGRKGDNIPERPHRKSILYQLIKLDDIEITSLEILQKLAAGTPMPALPGTTLQSPPYSQKSNQGRKMKKSELGPLNVEEYLTHFGIPYNVKATTDATFYRLERCIFNPHHDRNEAAIVVSHRGVITYQCFHSSCKEKKWKDAKQIISGDRKLIEFCTGYDPQWVPPQQVTGPGDLSEMPTDPESMMCETNPIVPPPAAIEPRWFYEKKGRRPVFVPQRLVQYLANYLRPICHTAGIFYRYKHGVWKEIFRTELSSLVVHTLKHEIQASWIDNAVSDNRRFPFLFMACEPAF